MPSEQQLAEHRRWATRHGKQESDEDACRCETCRCAGNCECGHRPLGKPQHLCELREADLRCWCCEIAGIQPPQGKE